MRIVMNSLEINWFSVYIAPAGRLGMQQGFFSRHCDDVDRIPNGHASTKDESLKRNMRGK
jgi:hypothetical protein